MQKTDCDLRATSSSFGVDQLWKPHRDFLLRRPYNPIAERLPRLHEHRQEPKPLMRPEHLHPVIIESHVILRDDKRQVRCRCTGARVRKGYYQGVIAGALLVHALYRRHINTHEVIVEIAEPSHEEGQYTDAQEGQHNHYRACVIRLHVIDESAHDFECLRSQGNPHLNNHEHAIGDQEKEVFPVVEANAVLNPRAMVVHRQHTPITHRAMMTSLRLEYMADQAVATFLLLGLIKIEPL